MSAPVRTFDPKQTSMIVGGKIMSGFADGTYIKVTRNEQSFTLKVGVDGEGSRAKSNNKSGKFEITLMQTSPSNDDLAALAAADEASGLGLAPCLMKDGSGRTVCQATTAWVQKQPDVELGKEVGTRTWVLESDEINMFVGGN